MATTGENDMELRKILDLTRYASILILMLHIYFYCYTFFVQLGWRSNITDTLMYNLIRTGLFDQFIKSKLLALGLLAIALIGVKGKKDDSINVKLIIRILIAGLILFLGSGVLFIFSYTGFITVSYTIITVTGYLFILTAGNQFSRLIRSNLSKDVFNEENETFPQEERLLLNEYSIHFSARYQLGRIFKPSKINVINPMRGTIVCGTPGSGKSWFVIRPMIKQMIEKGYAMFIYDFKYDDLSKPAFNWMIDNQDKYANPPAFYNINFDNLSVSNRCNPLYPDGMHDITDAAESARTILLGLNRQWIKRQGDFFVESAINFLTAVIWYLRKYGNGTLCTMPHAIEMMQTNYDELFAVLNTQPEVRPYINDFIKAYEDDVMETLSSQIASAKVAVARIASPQLYWVLTGNDFTLDINNPDHPKVVCVGNNPEKQAIYGAVLSLYISRMVKIVNNKDRQKCALIFDEFPTIYFNNMDSTIATARSNKVAPVLGMQDFSQLRKDYGREQADVIVNICGNIISGQVMGDSARLLSDRFGKIMQDRESFSINRTDTSISKSKQLEFAVPASKISSLSSGEFVGMVADDPHEKIKLKMFHAEILQDNSKLNEETGKFKDIPIVREVTQQHIIDNYFQVSQDIRNMIEQEMYKLEKHEEEIDEF